MTEKLDPHVFWEIDGDIYIYQGDDEWELQQDCLHEREHSFRAHGEIFGLCYCRFCGECVTFTEHNKLWEKYATKEEIKDRDRRVTELQNLFE